ncbi:MAG: hypothetical protein C0469_17915 [Cyanobacteria bacterium DS2.3.42]|nr:hypothetical protein [Cyanobacteria bacterium DS2.3.42]
MKKTKLTSLGLILVAVPVVFQFVLLSGMLTMLWSVQQESVRARESRNRVSRINDCMMGVLEFSFILVSARKDVDKNYVLNEVDQIGKDIVGVLEVVGRDPESAAQVKRVKESMNNLVSLADWMLGAVRKAKSEEERIAVIPRMSTFAGKFTAELATLIALEKSRRSQVFGISTVDRAKVSDWLIIFVVVNILSSLLMAVFFAARIKAPINHISNNLKLLSQNKPLLPALTMKDELGALDRLIHTVESELNNAHTKERALIEKAADLICSLDETGVFLTVNPMAARMLSIQPSELVSTKLSELTILEDSFAADELIRRSISSNDFQSAELTLRKTDGTTIETRWSCLWSDQEGSLFCVAHDITKEKELAQVKQDFMNMVSHDLRSPLSSVMVRLTMLIEGKQDELTTSFREEAESAVKSAEKLVGFIDDLLDFQKLSAGQMPLELKSHEAQTLVDEAVDLVKAYAKDRSIELKFDNEFAKVPLVCDGQKVVQVLVNLLSNAIKFSPARSVVQICVEHISESVRFSVSDEGPGVDADVRIAIFEPFQQTASTQHQGTGLGLAICKMIVEAHGGSIGVAEKMPSDSGETAQENVAKGSRFWFSIPEKTKS